MTRRGVLLIAVAGLLTQVPLANGEEGFNEKVLEWRTMVGVAAPFTGGTNQIRGISGGGLPWVFDRSDGQLRADGDLEIQVRGLVIDPSAASGNAGLNPLPFFRATVSCISADNGVVSNVNVTTAEADTRMIGDTTKGDAIIRAKLELPDPCIAPIVFVTSPGGSWFAATGVAGSSVNGQ